MHVVKDFLQYGAGFILCLAKGGHTSVALHQMGNSFAWTKLRFPTHKFPIFKFPFWKIIQFEIASGQKNPFGPSRKRSYYLDL